MYKNLLKRLANINPWHFLWIGVIISEMLTAVLTAILSIIWWGTIKVEILLIGSINAFVVAFLVICIVILFTNKVKEIQSINERLALALADRKRFEIEKQEIQNQFHQAQKMETIGRLAGGIAHDFNNILSIILGYSEFVLEELPKDSKLTDDIIQIRDAGNKAVSLTRQLLAFSRKQVLQMQVINPETIIQDMAKMISRMIGEDVDLNIVSSNSNQNIYADPGQIEQVLLNMAVNSRDAMPKGGQLSIELSTVTLEPEATSHPPEMLPGEYILISFADSGSGIPSDILDNIFEPFFTTKKKDKGTGLGLATVYGIVKQHNGYIYAASELDKGTTFNIYFPVSGKTPKAKKKTLEIKEIKGNETILIVEDEESLRQYIIDVLLPCGYNIISAENGEKALKISSEYKKEINLLLTDVIMPGINGKELADKLLKERPSIKVVFMSGYTDDVIVHHGVLDDGINLLQKPVRSGILKQKIRNVLDSPS